MNNRIKPFLPILFLVLLCLLAWCPAGLAKPEPGPCVEQGALVWNDWTSMDAGGSGLPAGETFRDYVRCKSCHGWDRRGIDGGYVRRTRTAERPNAGLGDSYPTSRNIAPGMGDYYHIRADEVLHAGTGRAYEEGSGSWVVLGDDPTADDKAAWSAGYTLGNQHPDFSTTGANAGDIVPTQEQVDCVALFVNFGDSDPNFYFVYIDTDQNPAVYVLNTAAKASAGQVFYQQICQGCHGDPATDYNGGNGGNPAGGILAYVQGDGKFSEFVHKARWGIPDTVMSRVAMGSPDSQNMIDVMAYLQALDPPDFAITGGISGTWYNELRDGEGFLFDVFPTDTGGPQLVASYYTYDDMGNQVWLVGSGMVDGNYVRTEMEITRGGTFGVLLNPQDVVRSDWGTLEFIFTSCSAGYVWVNPNAEMLAAGMGFEAFEFEINRLTPSSFCP